MKYAGEHIRDGLTNHDGKYFLYSLMAVFCASYCGLFFLKLDQIPTVTISLGIALAVYWQFRLQTKLSVSDAEETSNHRSIVTIDNKVAISAISVTRFVLQVYLWCGLSIKRNNRILTTQLAKLPLQFFRSIKVASGLMEKSIPWKIYQLEDMETGFYTLMQLLLVSNFIDESHHLMVICGRNMEGISDLFEVEQWDESLPDVDERLVEKMDRYYSLGRPLTIITQGISVDGIRKLNQELRLAVIPIQSRIEDSTMNMSVGSPVMSGADLETYIQVEANRVSKL
jgi:hypothetical protein